LFIYIIKMSSFVSSPVVAAYINVREKKAILKLKRAKDSDDLLVPFSQSEVNAIQVLAKAGSDVFNKSYMFEELIGNNDEELSLEVGIPTLSATSALKILLAVSVRSGAGVTTQLSFASGVKDLIQQAANPAAPTLDIDPALIVRTALTGANAGSSKLSFPAKVKFGGNGGSPIVGGRFVLMTDSTVGGDDGVVRQHEFTVDATAAAAKELKFTGSQLVAAITEAKLTFPSDATVTLIAYLRNAAGYESEASLPYNITLSNNHPALKIESVKTGSFSGNKPSMVARFSGLDYSRKPTYISILVAQKAEGEENVDEDNYTVAKKITAKSVKTEFASKGFVEVVLDSLDGDDQLSPFTGYFISAVVHQAASFVLNATTDQSELASPVVGVSSIGQIERKVTAYSNRGDTEDTINDHQFKGTFDNKELSTGAGLFVLWELLDALNLTGAALDREIVEVEGGEEAGDKVFERSNVDSSERFLIRASVIYKLKSEDAGIITPNIDVDGIGSGLLIGKFTSGTVRPRPLSNGTKTELTKPLSLPANKIDDTLNDSKRSLIIRGIVTKLPADSLLTIVGYKFRVTKNSDPNFDYLINNTNGLTATKIVDPSDVSSFIIRNFGSNDDDTDDNSGLNFVKNTALRIYFSTLFSYEGNETPETPLEGPESFTRYTTKSTKDIARPELHGFQVRNGNKLEISWEQVAEAFAADDVDFPSWKHTEDRFQMSDIFGNLLGSPITFPRDSEVEAGEEIKKYIDVDSPAYANLNLRDKEVRISREARYQTVEAGKTDSIWTDARDSVATYIPIAFKITQFTATEKELIVEYIMKATTGNDTTMDDCDNYKFFLLGDDDDEGVVIEMVYNEAKKQWEGSSTKQVSHPERYGDNLKATIFGVVYGRPIIAALVKGVFTQTM